MIDLLLTAAAASGLLSAGFVSGDWLSRRRAERLLRDTELDIRSSFAKIQALHNLQVVHTQEFADRLGSLELQVRGGKASSR